MLCDYSATRTSHVAVDPSILYFGTPVVLITTRNEDGSDNIMPMSSVFWLGHTVVLGFGTRSQTAANLAREGELVLNLPSVDMVNAVDRLALTTGRDPVPAGKAAVGYQHVKDKFAWAGLTRMPAVTVRAPRIQECPVHLEARVNEIHPLERANPPEAGSSVAIEARVTAVWVEPSIRLVGHANRIDPDRWRPLIMSFQQFYGLGGQVQPSRLSTIDEEWYR